MAIHADLLLTNGKIWLGRHDGVAEALAGFGGKVLASGSTQDMLALKGPQTRVIDLKGRFAMPGLNDSHLHLMMVGAMMGWADIRPANAPTHQKLLQLLKERADVTPKGQWITARGYDQTKLDIQRHPLREEIDQYVPDHPVLLVRTCGHISICNSMALKLANIDENTPDPDGGFFEKQNGRLTGLLAENARYVVQAAMPKPSDDELVADIERGARYLNSLGITSCMEAAVGLKHGLRELPAYFRARRDNRLPVRTWLTLLGDPATSIVPECLAAGLVSGSGDAHLMIGGVKIFLDGSCGGKTAWMSVPYLGEEKTHGLQMLPDSNLEAMVLDLHTKGYQLVCHAIGDAAIGQLITAYEKALAAHPDADRRHRIEHCGYATVEQNARMQKAGIVPCPQQVFMYDFGDAYSSVTGFERSKSAYPIKTWMDMGLKPATGSDAPVCDPSPFPNIYNMLTRKTWKGTVMDEGECLTIDEALQAYTEFGAYSQKQETVKGRLVPGMLCDIAVFSRDLLTATPDDILHNTQCDLTIVGGEVVFER